MGQPGNNELRQAVERLNNWKASHIKDITVIEKFGEKTVWSGVVSVFKIEGNPQADKCYAWSSPIEGSTKRRYYAMLHTPPIGSPETAVRASIVHDHKAGKLK